MRLEIPIYVTSEGNDLGERAYRMRALFQPRLSAEAPTLERATTRIAARLREESLRLARSLRHEELGALAFCPELTEKRLKLQFDLRRQTVSGKFLFVAFRQFDRWVAFSPAVQNLWFELPSLAKLKTRAVEVFQEHFRQMEKQREDHFESPSSLALNGPAWITTVEIQRSTSGPRVSAMQELFAMLGQQTEMDGEEELHRVGRRLRDLYPEELDRVVRYDDVVDEVGRLLRSPDRRPVLLLGPRRVGKTAVLHEVVHRKMQDPQQRAIERGHLWLVSPQRLISGMSYVGQWESRLTAILETAYKKDSVLVFDNVLGLFQAGRTMQSSLTVAHVLKPAMQRRRVRVVAEMTPEAFGKLRELDRAFADLFHVVRMEEPSETETYRILIDTQRRLESKWNCRFGIRAVPTVYDLERRFSRDSVFPGKGCMALRRLAMKSQGANAMLDRPQVLDEFQHETGLPMAFIDRSSKLDEETIREDISHRLVGQPQAIEAAGDVFGLVESRLNDPQKPIATMLLVGPTGVGKTFFAKELARSFFGTPERLVRFDMNQYVTERAAAQLVGDMDQPEGLLTAAIRRQPFSVVLLDEIEKAHDDVHNMLLQVMGEGRLTDALGRTCDFTNAILLLTSNLGTSHEPAMAGFSGGESQERTRVIRAVQQFFRPEFVNRLDRLIVFSKLSRLHMTGVARTLLDELFQRPGLHERRCIVNIDDEALEWIVDQGYQPELGARAIRRAIEQQLTTRVSEHLASAPADRSLTVVHASLGSQQLEVETSVLNPLTPAARSVGAFQLRDMDEALDALDDFYEGRLERLHEVKPSGPIESGNLTPQQLRYYDVQDSLQTLRDEIRSLSQRWDDYQREAEKNRKRVPQSGVAKPIKSLERHDDGSAVSDIAADLHAKADIAEYLRDVEAATRIDEIKLREQTLQCVREAAWISLALNIPDDQLSQRMELSVTSVKHPRIRHAFAKRLFPVFAEACGLDCKERAEEANAGNFYVEGAACRSLCDKLMGWHFYEKMPGFEVVGRLAPANDQAMDEPRDNPTDDPMVSAATQWQKRHVVVREDVKLLTAAEMRVLIGDQLPLPEELTRTDGS